MAAASLRSAYEALARGDSGPLVALAGPGFEWVEPDGAAFDVEELVEAGDRAVVTGVVRVAGAELPFAHVWELREGEPAGARAYFDRSRLRIAATRQQLADAADELLEQAAEIRRQWARLGDALRAAGLESAVEDLPAPAGGVGSARLVAVDMASEGSTREEVEAFLRDELGVEEPEPILDEVFAQAPVEPVDTPPDEEHARLSRLFARNRG